MTKRDAAQTYSLLRFSLRELTTAALLTALWMWLSFTFGGGGFCFGLVSLGVGLVVWGWRRKPPERIGCPIALSILIALVAPPIAIAIDMLSPGNPDYLRASALYQYFVLCSGYIYLQCLMFAHNNPIKSPFSKWWLYLVYLLQFPVTLLFYALIQAFLLTIFFGESDF